VAIVTQLGGVRRYVGEAFDRALEPDGGAWRVEREIDAMKARDAGPLLARAVGKAVVAQSLLADATEIGVGLHDRRFLLEARRFRKLIAQLVDRRMTIPGEIGRRFAGARRRVGIGGNGAHGLATAQEPARLGLADGDVRGREID